MAASSAARAANRRSGGGGGEGGTAVPRAARQSREGGGGGSGGGSGERLDMGPATVLEFFQMCDVENKGFITQRDMQVRSQVRGGAGG